MNKLYISIILILLVSSCWSPQEPMKSETIICGQVTGINEINHPKKNDISLYYSTLFKSELLNTKIDNEGNFRFTLELEQAQEFNLIYSDYLDYYLSPGDSLYIKIDSNCWNTRSRNLSQAYGFYHVTGTAEKMNKDYSQFKSFYRDSLFNRNEFDSMRMSSTPDQFKSYILNQNAEWVNVINDFNNKHETCEQFRDWIELYLTFDKWAKLITHPLSQLENKTNNYDIGEDYFDFIKEFKKYDESHINHSRFQGFFYNYQWYNDLLVPLDSQIYNSPRHKTDFNQSIKPLIEQYSNIPSSIVRDALIAITYHQMLDVHFEKTMGIYDPALIQNEYLKRRVDNKINSITELIDSQSGGIIFDSLSTKEVIKSLAEKHKGKVLYIDFWAPWCGPCILQFSSLEQLKNKVSSHDIVYIYLGNQCDKTSWKASIVKHQLTGEHYLLSDEQYESMAKTYGILGIPHYIIVDKSGEIANSNAPRPDSQEISSILNELTIK